MLRILAARAIAGVVGGTVLVPIAWSSAGVAKQPELRARVPAPAVHSRLPQQRQRFAMTTSCSGGSEGNFAFDSSTTFTTNNNQSEFGVSNLAAAEASGVFEGYESQICDANSAIGAGFTNDIDSGSGNAPTGARWSFIGAGKDNFISNGEAFIGAGYANSVSGDETFIGAGEDNTVSNEGSFIGAGDQNAVSTNDAFIGSGTLNTIVSAANYSVIAGGYGNFMSGQKASLGGGEQNDVTGSFATIPGGYRNEAVGNESFAAGSQAEARYAGSFVWSDYVSSEKPQVDSRPGEFVARASGGVYFFSNAASSAGVELTPGSGSWSSLSDRNAKTGIVPLDDASILAKVAALPINAWQYKTEHGVRHVGPMAQDFYAAFGVGEDDRHITSIDEDGIALAAIKALHNQNAHLALDNDRLHRQNAALLADFNDLRQRLERLEARVR